MTTVTEIPNTLQQKICCGDCVLIVGDEVILKEEYGQGSTEKYFKRLCKNHADENEEEYANMGDKERYNHFFSEVWEYDRSIVNPDLYALLETRMFPLVLVTTFDPVVEHVMREVWGTPPNVINVFDEASAGKFEDYSRKDRMPPTICYFFGDASRTNFHLWDDDAITAISRWIERKAFKPIVQHISSPNCPLMAIGCKFDDWEFRFMWYCLLRDGHNTIGHKLSGHVAISLNTELESDKKLSGFLKGNKVDDYGDARQFMQRLSATLRDPKCQPFLLERDGVFISYAHEDRLWATHIYSVLRRQYPNMKIWLDRENLEGGDEYMPRILEAIDNCKVFLMILTKHTKADLEQNAQRFYSATEWMHADPRKIFPIAVDGFDSDQDAGLFESRFPQFSGKSIKPWGSLAMQNQMLATTINDRLHD